MRVGLIHQPLFQKHLVPTTHPESPQRLLAIDQLLRQLQLLERVTLVTPRPATDKELLSVHTTEHLERVRSAHTSAATQNLVALDADTFVGRESFMVAQQAAGSLLELLQQLLVDQTIDTGVALIRPPGHHAESNKPMGFCLFNNVAVAAAQAIDTFGCKRVAIIDWDVHHGNGTQEIFYQRDDVLYISSHQYPFYPGTGTPTEIGAGPGSGYTINFPLPAHLPEEEMLALYEQIIVPIVKKYAPELLIVSAGYDAHRDDPLGQLQLTEWGFSQLTMMFEALRRPLPQLKTLYALEGGYNVTALAACVADLLKLLSGFDIKNLPSHTERKTDASAVSNFIRYLLRTFPPKLLERWDLLP